MNEITKKFEQEQLKLSELAKLFKTTTEEVVRSLKEDGYLYVAVNAKPVTMINLKLAGEEYINSRLTLAEIENKCHLSRGRLSPYLKEYLGFEKLEVRKKVTKFDDTVFDIIDTEEKAYWLGFIFADGTISSSPLIEGKRMTTS